MKDIKDFDDVRWDDGKPTVNDYVWGRDNQTASLIRAYKDEVSRLREALQEIIKLDDDWKPETLDDYSGTAYEHCANIARAVLGEKKR